MESHRTQQAVRLQADQGKDPEDGGRGVPRREKRGRVQGKVHLVTVPMLLLRLWGSQQCRLSNFSPGQGIPVAHRGTVPGNPWSHDVRAVRLLQRYVPSIVLIPSFDVLRSLVSLSFVLPSHSLSYPTPPAARSFCSFRAKPLYPALSLSSTATLPHLLSP